MQPRSSCLLYRTSSLIPFSLLLHVRFLFISSVCARGRSLNTYDDGIIGFIRRHPSVVTLGDRVFVYTFPFPRIFLFRRLCSERRRRRWWQQWRGRWIKVVERSVLSRPTVQCVSSNLSVSSIATTRSLPLPSFVFIYAYLSFQFPCRLLLNFSLDMTIHFSVVQWWDTHPKRLLLRIRSFSFSSLSRSVFWIHTHTACYRDDSVSIHTILNAVSGHLYLWNHLWYEMLFSSFRLWTNWRFSPHWGPIVCLVNQLNNL